MPLLESQYITISDLQRVRMMMTIFRDVLSVPDDEKAIVGRMLGKWSDELYAALPELTEGLEDEDEIRHGCDCPECGGSGRESDEMGGGACNHCGGDGYA